MKVIASRSNNDRNDYDIDLIKNLNLIKTKLQREKWIENWNDDDLDLNGKMDLDEMIEYNRKRHFDEIVEQSIRGQMIDTYKIVEEMVENNDCYVVTKVSRTVLKLVGKAFQGIAELIIA